MSKNVEQYSDTWNKMKGAIGNITESSGGSSGSPASGNYSLTSGNYSVTSSYSGNSGSGFDKRVKKLVTISKEVDQ